MCKKPKLAAQVMAVALPLFAGAVNTYTVYKIDIEKSFIKASADDAIIELKLVGGSLVVDTLPGRGFCGVKVGDQISKANVTTIQGTHAFIAALKSPATRSQSFKSYERITCLSCLFQKKAIPGFFDPRHTRREAESVAKRVTPAGRSAAPAL